MISPSEPRPAPGRKPWSRILVAAGLVFMLLQVTACRPGSSSVTLALLGDVMLGRSVHPSEVMFRALEPYLASADLVLANLESPLTGQPPQVASPYVLCAPPENVKFLAGAGFDLFSLANNHSLDCGAQGLAETQSTLQGAGLDFIGPDPGPVFREIHGMPLAFLAFDATSSLDLDEAERSVLNAHDAGALVIVSVHWGAEYQSGESEQQRQTASRLAEAGAALIWGHHPHVLQPVSWLNGGRTLVLYSLGNAMFDQHGLESTRRSELVLVRLNRKRVDGYRTIPFMIDVQESRIVISEK